MECFLIGEMYDFPDVAKAEAGTWLISLLWRIISTGVTGTLLVGGFAGKPLGGWFSNLYGKP